MELYGLLFDTATVEVEDAQFYGSIRVHLETLKPNARPIGADDLFLAAQALRLGATLVTNNTREFSRVPGLSREFPARHRPVSTLQGAAGGWPAVAP